MGAAEKVVQLNSNIVYNDIQTYLDELETHSKGTRASFEAKIREFFRIMRGKEIEFLTEDDLYFKRNDILKFRKILLDRGDNQNSTINTKITAVKSLFENLKANEYKVNTSIFNFKRLKEHVNSYGNLSQTEAERFAEAAKLEKNKPIEKYLLIKFAIRTSFRLDEILNVKWSNFDYQNGVYVITIIGKGQKENKNSISHKFYEELLTIKQNNSEYVFNMNEKTVNRMMVRLRDKLNIDPKRNIAFHSFRKVAIDWEYETTGDLKKAALQGNHSRIDTMYQHYLNKERDFTQTPGVKMDEEIDWGFLDKINENDLKDFIKKGGYRMYNEIKKHFNE